MPDWEPKFRYWVAERRDHDWVCVYRTNWRWRARHVAKRRSRKGFGMKVSTR